MLTVKVYFKIGGEIKPSKITVNQNNSTPLSQYCKYIKESYTNKTIYPILRPYEGINLTKQIIK